MKKRKILLSVLSLVLLVGVIVGVMSMSTSAARGTGGTITQNGENPWLSEGLNLVKGTDYAYSFAVVGDTQNLNYKDIGASTTNMNTLYQWLVNNKDAMNIQYVMGVGDITQSWTRTYGDKYYAEWVHAAEAVSLLDGKIPYSLVRGNHDFSDAKDGFNGVFGVGDKKANGVDNQYYETLLEMAGTVDESKDANGNVIKNSDGTSRYMAGFRLDGKIEETYRKVTMGDQKYIIFTLDWHPMSKETDCVTNAADLCKNEEYCYVHYSVRTESSTAKTCENDSASCKYTKGCKLHHSYVNGTTFCSTSLCTDDCTKHDTLGWLNGLLRENSDYTAIITLHSFIMRDGSTVDDIEDVFPYENVNNSARPGWHEVATTGGNVSPKQLWDEVLSKHANVKMLFCGHVDEDNLVTTQLRGDKGNTVTCMLVDGQTIDSDVEPVGLVAMYYMSADGSVVDVEYISTVRAAAGKPAYLRAVNQIKDLPLNYSSWTETEYGPIPTDVYNEYTFHVMLDDDSDPSTLNTLYGSYNTWEETITRVTELNGVANAESRKAKTYNIIMSKDYTFTNTGLKHNQMCNNASAVVFDLNGKTFTLNSGTTFLPFYNATASLYPKFTVKNGNFVMQGTSRLIVTQHGHPKNASGSKIDVNLTDLNITYASGATGSVVHPFSMSEKSETRSTVNLNVTNCNIDASAAGSVHIFNLKDKWDDSDVILNIKGGSIKGSTAANTKMFIQNWPSDKVTFLKDGNGNYTTFIFNENAQLDGVFYSETAGTYLELGAPVEQDGKYVTALTSTTKIIVDQGYVEAAKWNDTESYPFVVFNKYGKAVLYFNQWGKEFVNPSGGVLNNAELQSGSTVVLRRDGYTTQDTQNPWYLCYATDMTIDLGGHTITRGNNGLFSFLGRNATKHTANVTIKNGTVIGQGGPAIYFDNQTGNVNANNTGTDTVNLTVENVDFDVSNGQSVIGCSTSNIDFGITANVVFNNCDFLRGTRTSTNTLFALAESSAQNKCDIRVTVNGGTIQANNMANLHIATYSLSRDGMDGSPDSVIFGKGSKAPQIILPKTYTVPATPINLSDGNYYLAKLQDNEDNTTSYILALPTPPDRLDTPYGYVTEAYASAETYPFAVFFNGEFKKGYTTLATAMTDAKAYVKSDADATVYVVLRRNYVSAGSESAGTIYDVKGKIVVNLNEYELSSTSSKRMLDMHVNYPNTSASFASEIVFMNGTIKNSRTASNPALVTIGHGTTTGYDESTTYTQKEFKFTFEDVTFKTANAPIIQAWNHSAPVGLKVNINAKNCTFDYTGAATDTTMFYFKSDYKNVYTNITLEGCNVIASKLVSYNLWLHGAEDNLILKAGANGSYLTVTQTSKTTPIFSDYVTNDGASPAYKLVESASGKYVYELLGETKKVWSDYPEIPVAHLDDAATYPFVLFYNGQYRNVYNTLVNAYAAAKAFVDTEAEVKACDTVYIVMRKDFVSAQIPTSTSNTVRGKVVIDLQGYQLSSNNCYLMDSAVKYSVLTTNGNNNDVSKWLGFVTEVTFKNGIIKNTRDSNALFNTAANDDVYLDTEKFAGYERKAYVYNFENITFSTVKNAIMHCWNQKCTGTEFTVNLKNCTFDFTGANSGTTMFSFGGSTHYTDGVPAFPVELTIEGGTVKASLLSSYNIYTIGDDDTAVLVPNANGSYLTVIQTTKSTPTTSFVTKDGKTVGYTDGNINSTNDAYVYELVSAIETKYGTISAAYADARKYPVAMFYADKTFIAGYQDLDLAYAKALESGNLSKSFVILIRRDMTKNTNKNIGGTFTGSIVVDMDGHTVTVTESGNYFLDISVSDAAATGASFTVMNGKYVKEKGRGFICLNYSVDKLSSGASEIGYSFNFVNVTFESQSAHNNNNVIFTTWEANYATANYKVVATSVFENCTFDLKNSIPTAQMLNLNYDANGTRDRVVHNVTIKGGTIIADAADDINTNFAKLDGDTNGRADSIKFEADDDGNGISLVLPAGVSASDITFVGATVEGVKCVFVKTSENGGNNVYELVTESTYGKIPLEYSSAIKYPFVIFKTDGTFVGGYTTFAEAAAAAGLIADYTATTPGINASAVDNADCVILLRRDYTLTKTVTYVANYDNDVTIDLGGNTITSDGYSFLELKNTASYAKAGEYGTILIKDGTFNYNKGGNSVSIIRASGKVGTYPINFTDVTIRSTNTTSTGKLYVAISTAGSTNTTENNIVNSVFTDCVFDFTEAQAACYMFASGAGKDKAIINATIRGGKILAGNNNAILAIDTATVSQGLAYYQSYPTNSNDTLKIEKNANGEYLKFVLNSSASAPAQTNVYTTADGVECVFVKASDDGTNTTYTLYPKVMVGYKLQTSVTLYSNFVYNVYIPVANVKEFAVTFNGKSINEYKTEIIEGVEYYCVSVNLPAPETLNDIKVKVTLNSGSTTVDANWTLNVLKYAKSVLADTDTDDLTKASQTLVKDMLVYAKAAHTYFGETASVADKLTEITTILGTYSATLPAGDAKKPTDKTYFTDVAVYVGEVPSFRFYLAEGYTAANFTFTVGGNAVDVKEENGYVEIAMYAYRMLDDVTFTVNGTDVSESYNLYSYYSFVTDPANTDSTAELVAIVEALMKYSKSASAYRESVINK